MESLIDDPYFLVLYKEMMKSIP